MNSMPNQQEDALVGKHMHRANCGDSFLDILRKTTNDKKDATFATWYDINGNAVQDQTFGGIWEEAGVIAHHLHREWKVEKGERVVLCYDFGLQFFSAFLGCLRAGVVATLVYPPSQPLQKSLTKLQRVIDNCSPKLILTDSKISMYKTTDINNPFSKTSKMWPEGIPLKVTDNLHSKQKQSSMFSRFRAAKDDHATPAWDEPNVSSEDTAFIQYTSGSCGDPKGVVVSFGNLKANVNLLLNGVYELLKGDSIGTVPDCVSLLSWLPQYHDMGLVYATIVPFVDGWRAHYMSPVSFIKKPLLWMDLMSRHKVAVGVAPDFAYRLVVRKFVEAQTMLAKKQSGSENGGDSSTQTECPIPNLDLSCVRLMSNAAEPVRPDTHSLFGDLFAKYGLTAEYNAIGYGLAEHVVTICWTRGHHPSPAAASPAVGSRQTFDSSVMVKVVDPNTHDELEDGRTGEVWVSGPCVAQGYYGKAELSQEVFSATCNGFSESFLRTGDLGFFENDHLYICGRMKDLIILNGVNYYPQDIEAAVMEASEAVRQGCVAAFSKDETKGDGELEIVFEVRKDHEACAAEVVALVHTAIMEKIGLFPNRIVAIKERSIPKTTSGKIQRRATRQELHDNNLSVIAESGQSPSLQQQEDDGDCDVEAPVTNNPELTFLDIVAEVVGHAVDPHKTWDELGVSSIALSQLESALTGRFQISLEAGAFDEFNTPCALESHVAALQAGTLPSKCPPLPQANTVAVPWWMLTVLQLLGVVGHFFLFAISVVPSYYFVSQDVFKADVANLVTLPLVIPIWMLSLSLLVVIAKWTVVGRYKAHEFAVNSLAYLRWWWVDRALHYWEFLVGRSLKKTFFIWLFYRMLGANVDITAKLDAFVREFDLVKVGESASVEHQIRCRKFGPWKKDAFPMLRFRPTVIGNGAVVRGILSPGAHVGEGAFVDSCSVAVEGGQVPPGKHLSGRQVVGSAAAGAGPSSQESANCDWLLLENLKILWLFVELYLFFGFGVLSTIMLDGSLLDWRYRPLVFRVLQFAMTSVFNIALAILLKWVVIGKRRPGPVTKTVWKDFSYWAVDFHFRTSTWLLVLLFSNHTIMWNVVLMLFGMDVDFSSKVDVQNYPPSKVDLIRVKNSFLRISAFHTKKIDCESGCEVYCMTEVSSSNVGINAVLGPGVKVSNAVIAPGVHVTQNMERQHPDKRMDGASSAMLVKLQAGFHILHLIALAGLLSTLVPPFELWKTFPENQNAGMFVVLLAASFPLISISAVILLVVIQAATEPNPSTRSSPWCVPLIQVYLNMSWVIQSWTILPLLWGTPLFGFVAKLLGVNAEGRFLFNGDRLYDIPYLTIADRTVLDEVHANGHYQVFSETKLGRNTLSGLQHEGTMTFANSTTPHAESGPWHAYF